MTMSNAERVFGQEIEAALEKYLANTDNHPEGEMLADWVVGYSRQKLEDDGDVTWANSLIRKRGQNPNAHVGLAAWVSDCINNELLDDIEEDEG